MEFASKGQHLCDVWIDHNLHPNADLRKTPLWFQEQSVVVAWWQQHVITPSVLCHANKIQLSDAKHMEQHYPKKVFQSWFFIALAPSCNVVLEAETKKISRQNLAPLLKHSPNLKGLFRVSGIIPKIYQDMQLWTLKPSSHLTHSIHKIHNCKTTSSSWWLQPIWKLCSFKLDHFPK